MKTIMSSDSKFFGQPSHTDDFFQNLDKNHIGLTSCGIESFKYAATNVVVSNTMEIPIIVQFPESRVSYEFATSPAGIMFSIIFIPAIVEGEESPPDDELYETIEESSSFRSDIEPVAGSFDCSCEGVVFFMFDNSAGWTTQELSYFIEVQSPCFDAYDEIRSFRSITTLRQIASDIESCSIRLADAEVAIENSSDVVGSLERKLALLEREIATKQDQWDSLEAGEDKVLLRVMDEYKRLDGLCMRLLDWRMLGRVLQFAWGDPGKGEIECCPVPVSKFWVSAWRHSGGVPILPARPRKNKIRSGAAQITSAPTSTTSTSTSTPAPTTLPTIPTPSNTINDAPASGQPSESAGWYPIGVLANRRRVTLRGSAERLPLQMADLYPPVPSRLTSESSSIEHASVNDYIAASVVSINVHDIAPKISRPVVVPLEELEELTREAMLREQEILGESEGGSGSEEEEEEEDRVDMEARDVEQENVVSMEPSRPPAPIPDPPITHPTKKSIPLPYSNSAPSSSSPRTHRSKKSISITEYMAQHRAEEQLIEIIGSVQRGLDKIEMLTNEKRKIKRVIKMWNVSFERQFGRPASREEKQQARGHYVEYQRLTRLLQVRIAKVENIFSKLGITKDLFFQLRDELQV